jgi:cell division protein YceG involved in septum cleavage
MDSEEKYYNDIIKNIKTYVICLLVSISIVIIFILLAGCTTRTVFQLPDNQYTVEQSSNHTVEITVNDNETIIKSETRNIGILESGFAFIGQNLKSLFNGIKGIFRQPDAAVDL